MSKPNITRKPGEPLTKENFWNALKQAYPTSIDNFCGWIDLYKHHNAWNELFNPDGIMVRVAGTTDKMTDRAPKFHDLPLAMQIGIIIEYLESNKALWVVIFAMDETGRTQRGVQPDLIFSPFIECLVAQLVTYFKDEHEETAAEHRAEKLKPFKDNEPFNS